MFRILLKILNQKCDYSLQEIEEIKEVTGVMQKQDTILAVLSSVALGFSLVEGGIGIAMNAKNIWNMIRTAYIP